MTSKLLNMAAGLFSVGFAFVAWGYLSSLAGAQPSPASLSVLSKDAKAISDHQRELVLSEAKSSKPKGADKEATNVLLNDQSIQTKWGLEKTSAAKAWEITKGSKDIVIAVIDTGVDVYHKDISDNLWKNPGESGIVDASSCRAMKDSGEVKRCFEAAGVCAKNKEWERSKLCNKAINGIDDDGNGFTDDVHGWNFVHNNHQLVDNHGHGTHIAGIIGAKGGPNGAVSGVAPNVSLMILKYYDPKASNSNNLKNTVQAIRYAIAQKVKIINYSGGGIDYSAEEFAAVKEAEKAGILFVAAAGNERSNSDEAGKHYYPADYALPNIISVTAVNKEETKVLASSNYGVRTVDLAAPGENIYSTIPDNKSGYMTGTSQATAFVTGVAALIMSHHREFNAADVKKYILRTGDEYSTLLSKTGTAKLLNSYKALTSLDKGVGVSGIVATNTSKMGAKEFSSSRDLKNLKFKDTSALGSDDNMEEPAEAIASFGKAFLKAMDNVKAGGTDEVRQR
jgi:subtilisin family serine protease